MASLLSLQMTRSYSPPTTHRLLNPVDSPNGFYFGALPEEIIVKILEWCDFGGVLACQRVRLALYPRLTTALITHQWQ